MPHRANSLRTDQQNSHHSSANSTSGWLGIGEHLFDEGSDLRRDRPARCVGAAAGAGAGARRRRIEACARRGARDRPFLFAHVGWQCPRTAACSGSARRCRAACTARTLPGAASAAHLQRAGERGAAGDAGEDAFASRQLARQAQRIVAVDRQRRGRCSCASMASSVSLGMKSGDQPCIRCGRNAGWLSAGAPSARRGCGDAAAEDRRIVRLADHDARVRALRLEHARRRP